MTATSGKFSLRRLCSPSRHWVDSILSDRKSNPGHHAIDLLDGFAWLRWQHPSTEKGNVSCTTLEVNKEYTFSTCLRRDLQEMGLACIVSLNSRDTSCRLESKLLLSLPLDDPTRTMGHATHSSTPSGGIHQVLVEAEKQRHSLIQFIEFAVFLDVGLGVSIAFAIDTHEGVSFRPPTDKSSAWNSRRNDWNSRLEFIEFTNVANLGCPV